MNIGEFLEKRIRELEAKGKDPKNDLVVSYIRENRMGNLDDDIGSIIRESIKLSPFVTSILHNDLNLW